MANGSGYCPECGADESALLFDPSSGLTDCDDCGAIF